MNPYKLQCYGPTIEYVISIYALFICTSAHLYPQAPKGLADIRDILAGNVENCEPIQLIIPSVIASLKQYQWSDELKNKKLSLRQFFLFNATCSLCTRIQCHMWLVHEAWRLTIDYKWSNAVFSLWC